MQLKRAGQWVLCGGLCVLLGACSTLGAANHKQVSHSPTHSPKTSNASATGKETKSLQASYRPSSPGSTVTDLPDAMDYSVDKNRKWVDELDSAPMWTRTPEELAPSPYKIQPSAPPEPDNSAQEVALPWVDDLSRESLKEAIQKQLGVMEHADLTRRVRIGPRRVTRQHLVDTLHAFMNLLEQDISEEEFNRLLNEQFEIISVGYHRAGRPVVFTGYYTPIIPARREKTEDFIFPLYQKPEWYPEERAVLTPREAGYHLTQISDQPLLTREDIDGRQALSNQQLELAWLKDDLERYFLHIQGSGYLAFPDGTLQAVQYMGSNHFPYHSVGKQMLKDGVIKPAQGSMQGMKQYFHDHPENIDKYLFRNNRYIFFQMSNHSPRGSSGAELVAGRSIATDKSLYPAGGLVHISVEKPVLNDELEITGWQKVSRFVIDQDTGSAIKGPGQVDLYFGVGEPAGAAAGHYKRTGKMSYLLKK